MRASTLLPNDGVVIVAVSGGADSMALIDALLHGDHTTRFVVAHFDHKLRVDSARDAQLVAAYARTHGLEFVRCVEDIGRRARAQRKSVEEAARDARYEFFAETAAHKGAAAVVTAHTQTDQVETVLMRILRGTGTAGAVGIPERRGLYARPLLGVTRADTRDYCTSRGVAFLDDASNGDVRFFRNRIRHEVLPQLRVAFPAIDESLLKIAERARCERAAYAARTQGWFERFAREESEGVYVVRTKGFDSVDDSDASELLRDVFARAGYARNVGRVHYRALLELVRSAHAGGAVDIPGFSARREHDAIVLRRRSQTPEDVAPFSVPVSIPGRTRAGDWNIDVSLVEVFKARLEASSRGSGLAVAFLDVADLSLPLVARSVQPGDAMRPSGLGGTKKLSDVFIDRKIPRRERATALVIESKSIVWVPGVARSDIARIRDTTEYALRVEARREERPS